MNRSLWIVAFRPLQRSTPDGARKQPEGCGPHGCGFKDRVHGFLAVETSHEPGRASLSPASLSDVFRARRAARRDGLAPATRFMGREHGNLTREAFPDQPTL
ncbi:MAG: hypothetical protein FJ398_07715 [Verrucomicrobia bacterium]|nr:hypothetical protein [Verrucomicrobiota bacterium]